MKLKDLKELIASGDDNLDLSEILPKQEQKILLIPEVATELPVEGMFANFKHSCNPGDIVASLVAVKKYWEVTKRKARFLQSINMPAAYYPGAVHGTKDEGGTMVTLNKPLFDMMKPLVESQEYIESFDVYEGQTIHVDFDVIRGKTFVNMPQGSIQAWLFYAYPDLHSDISKPWIYLEPTRRQIEDVTKGKVIINFTERYRNDRVILDYFFLKEYAPDLIFAGTEQEHFKFCHQWGLNIPRLEVRDFLELAYAIRGCRFLLSNQSLCWNIATAINKPRVLEVCSYAHNCMPFYGDGNLGFFHQVALAHYFREMYRDTIYK